MLTKKLLAAFGLAGALLLGVTAPASAHEWGGSRFRPAYRGEWGRYRDWRAEHRREEWRRYQWLREHQRHHYPYGYRY